MGSTQRTGHAQVRGIAGPQGSRRNAVSRVECNRRQEAWAPGPGLALPPAGQEIPSVTYPFGASVPLAH